MKSVQSFGRGRRVVPAVLWCGALIAVGCATNANDGPAPVPDSPDGSAGGGTYGYDAGQWLGLEEAGTVPTDDEPPKQPPPPKPDGGSDAATDAPSGAVKPAPGEVIITEVMYDPAGSGAEPDHEWFELYNVANGPRILDGLNFEDGSTRTHTIASLTIAPRSYVVVARNKSAAAGVGVPAAAIAYEYGTGLSSSSGVLLSNGSTGGVALRDGTTDIARVPYGGWFTQDATGGGQSIQLKGTSAEATTAAGWCLSDDKGAPLAGGSDHGTPGAASNCP